MVFSNALGLSVELTNLISRIPGVSLLEHPSFSRFPSFDPFRLTVGVQQLGLSGYEAYEILHRDYGVAPEMVGTRSVTFVINLGTCREHGLRLVSGMKHISDTAVTSGGALEEIRLESGNMNPPLAESKMCLTPREAFFARKRRVRTRESLGEICGELICPFPPGSPAMIPGEVVTQRALDYVLHVKRKGAVINGASDPSLSSMVICHV